MLPIDVVEPGLSDHLLVTTTITCVGHDGQGVKQDLIRQYHRADLDGFRKDLANIQMVYYNVYTSMFQVS